MTKRFATEQDISTPFVYFVIQVMSDTISVTMGQPYTLLRDDLTGGLCHLPIGKDVEQVPLGEFVEWRDINVTNADRIERLIDGLLVDYAYNKDQAKAQAITLARELHAKITAEFKVKLKAFEDAVNRAKGAHLIL